MKKNILFFGIIIIVIILSILLIDINLDGGIKDDEQIGTISLVIDVQTLIGKNDNIPNDGIIYTNDVAIYEGDTAFTILQRVTEKEKIAFDYTGLFDSRYVRGIAGIYEFDYGATSGWLFSVNGEKPNVSSANYILEDGDKVCWLYSCTKGDS